jgi:aldose 1-epimerase
VTAPSGEQIRLLHGDQEVVVTGVGASLRRYAAGGREILAGYAEDEVAPSGRGQVLAPWPNRLADGEYRWEGVAARAALDEPAHHNAIHGLVRWLTWRVTARQDAAVTLACPLAPQPAYPFSLGLVVRYELGAGGLSVEVEARCEGTAPIPFGIGFHPYLAPAHGHLDGTLLRLPGARRVRLDDRGLPSGEANVAGTDRDFRQPRPLGDLELDDCFTALEAETEAGPWPEDAWTAAVMAADGNPAHATTVWADRSFPYLMCFTADTLAGLARRASVALEPMTCPPNALRTGKAVVKLEPGAIWRGTWGICPPGRAGEANGG